MYRIICWALLLVMTVVFLPALPVDAQDGQPLEVTLTVDHPSSYEPENEPVTLGVPIPRDVNLIDLEQLRLLDRTGQPLPAQFTPLARWGGAPGDESKPVRWLLVDFQFRSAPDEEDVSLYRLVNSGGAQPQYQQTLLVEEAADSLILDTGAAQFTFDRTSGILTSPHLSEPFVGRAVGADGTIYTTTGPAQVSVEMVGPMRVVVHVKGSYRDAGGTALLDYTSRYWFYASRGEFRLFHTIENNTPCPLAEDRQLDCYHIGDGGSVNVQDVSLILSPDFGGPVQAYVPGGGETDLTGDLLVYQDSSGTDYWDHYPTLTDWDGNLLDTRPRMQSYVSFRGFRVTSDSLQFEGDQAAGWLGVTGGGRAWTVYVHDFWQNFPKALRVSLDGVVEIGLFPAEFGPEDYAFTLRAGEHKTHEMLVTYEGEGSSGYKEPLSVQIAPEWYVQSGGFGMTTLRDFEDWPEHEEYIDHQLTTAPIYEEWMNWYPNLFAAIERTDFYGIFDYGDWPIDYEGFGVTPLNVKYDNNFGTWVQWARGGDPRWAGLAEALNRHAADVDILHNRHEPRHWGDGITFGHSYHDEAGFSNPHRNEGGAHPDVAYGMPGLLVTYYLTGYEKAWESAMELADCVEYRVHNDWMLCDYFADCTGEGWGLSEGMYDSGSRPVANSLVILTEAYRATGDSRYLEAAEALVDWARPEKQPYIDGLTGEDMIMKPWLMNMYLRALAYYIEMRDEFGLPDDSAKDHYITYIDWLREYALIELEPIDDGPRAAYPYEWWLDGREGDINDEWAVGNNIPSINGWLLLGADAMAYAYELSGDPVYLTTAASLFRTGTRDPWFLDDANTYSSTKETLNSITYGNIFLHVWQQQ